MKDKLTPYKAGVIGWIVGFILVFGLSWSIESPETLANAVMWTIQNWWAAYAFGGIVLILTALLKRITPMPSLTAYVVPVAFMTILAMACLWVYPDAGFRIEFMSFMPLIIVFYLLSMIWVSLRKNSQSAGDSFRTLVPTVLGGTMLLAMVAIPVFSSNTFKYQDAFNLKITEVLHPEKSMVAKGILEIRKPGNYEFSAPTFFYFDMISGFDPETDHEPKCSIAWGEAGKPAAGATGTFPIELVWSNIPVSIKKELASMPADTLPILLEARSAEEPDELLYTIDSEGTVEDQNKG
jgi:hypothetical protein